MTVSEVRPVGEQGEGVIDRAKRLIKQGQHQEAVELLEPWLAENSDDPSAWAAIGAAYFELENWTEAEKAAREVVRLRPDIAREWCNLGVVLRKSGQHARAEEAQKRALELDADNDRAKVELQKARRAGTTEPAAPDNQRSPTSPRPARKLVVVSLFGLSVLVVAVVVGVLPRLRDQPASPSPPASSTTSAGSRAPAAARSVSPAPPAAAVPLTRRQMVSEGRRLYDEQRYTEALTLFEEAAEQGSNDGLRWADSCRKRMEEITAAERAEIEAAKAAAEAEKLRGVVNPGPSAAVRAQAVSSAKAAVSKQIVVSLKDGSRGARFLSARVSVVTGQVATYEDNVPVWSGSLLVSGVVQIPTVPGGGEVWKDYAYLVRVVKPPGQGSAGQRLTVQSVSVEMR